MNKLEYKGLGGKYAEVYIDGVKQRVRNIDIRHHLNEIPTVTLELISLDMSVEGEFNVINKTDEIKQEMCDQFCRMPYECTEDELLEKCENCPLDRL